MRWIGLTGGIGSGKSTVSEILRAKGYRVVDADQLAREVVLHGTEGHGLVVQAFGPDIVDANGNLDRKKIADIVFRDRSRLELLEGILHPRIRALAEKRRQELEQAGHALAFYDVPLLFEKKMQSMFEKVIVVSCDPSVQLQRLMARDGLTREVAEKRMAAQMPLAEKARLADVVVLNNGSLQDLATAVDAALASL